MKVAIDRASCVGYGMCHIHAGDLFGLDEEGRGVVRLETVPAELYDEAYDGAEACPQRAITVED
ncbi:ferredoxin [Nocardioides sp.]|uniref:ferredoxin n=1 Tax=Nocardioides sp. TaxID=35761 RepID=UPI00321C2624